MVWRYLLEATDIDAYSREMTSLAEATLAAGWQLALDDLVARHGVPRASGRFITSVLVGAATSDDSCGLADPDGLGQTAAGAWPKAYSAAMAFGPRGTRR